jgi:two-component system, OmpR family, KDP operon response regulator KdpE
VGEGTKRVIKVLIVDDEPQILRALRINLRARDYEVEVAGDGAGALKTASAYHPDLIVLDLGLPDMDGVDVIRGVRGWSDAPIIVLSGRAGSGDKVIALDAGADDYVTKPFGVDELLARMRAATRRHATHTESPSAVRIGEHIVDIANHRVTGPGSGSGSDVRLTPTEWHLLSVLVRNPGKLVSQRQLLHDVWGPQYESETNYLRQYMAQLRRKLEPDPAHPRQLVTEPGMGYRFLAQI